MIQKNKLARETDPDVVMEKIDKRKNEKDTYQRR